MVLGDRDLQDDLEDTSEIIRCPLRMVSTQQQASLAGEGRRGHESLYHLVYWLDPTALHLIQTGACFVNGESCSTTWEAWCPHLSVGKSHKPYGAVAVLSNDEPRTEEKQLAQPSVRGTLVLTSPVFCVWSFLSLNNSTWHILFLRKKQWVGKLKKTQ